MYPAGTVHDDMNNVPDRNKSKLGLELSSRIRAHPFINKYDDQITANIILRKA